MADEPNPAVYQRFPTFICLTRKCVVTVNYLVRPEREIAGNFLEQVGEWLRDLERETAPERVLFALRAVHDAACRWTDDLDKVGES
jgi:hypothetical protein